mgnify:CR=1 FL=1
MDAVWTAKDMTELATATAANVGYEAIRWWIDEANPSRLRVEARPLVGFPAVSILLTAVHSQAAAEVNNSPS